MDRRNKGTMPDKQPADQQDRFPRPEDAENPKNKKSESEIEDQLDPETEAEFPADEDKDEP